MTVKRIWRALPLLLVFALSGCSGLGTRRGSDGSPLPTDGASTGVTVTPATATIRAGSNEAFAATVSGSANNSVTWSVNSIGGGNAAVGTIDANGMYTATASLPTPNSVTVTATSAADTTQKGTSTITLQNPIPVLNSVAPTSIPVGSFSLTLTGSGFVKNSTVTFGGQGLTTTYVSPTELQASGTAATTQIGMLNIVVQNPDPGAAVSSALTASVVAAAQPVSQVAAVRFLEQSTFGPTPTLVNQVAQNGFDITLQAQFAAPASKYPTPLPSDTGVSKVQNQFFINAVNDGDQVRQRVAFALNEMWVVSQNKVNDPTGYTNYMTALTNDALGNYYNVMKDVTLTPAMGHYLDMVNNDKPASGQHANEKLCARADATLHAGTKRAEFRRHGADGWKRKSRANLYARRRHGAGTRIHRMDISY